MTDNLYGPGYVYLLERNDGWYRIGRTANPVERFRSWRWMQHNGYKLYPLLLISVDNQAEAETLLHKVFDGVRTDDRHRGMGPRCEWFKLSLFHLLCFAHWAKVIGNRIYYLKGSWQLPDGL
jgi:hypothetical protein